MTRTRCQRAGPRTPRLSMRDRGAACRLAARAPTDSFSQAAAAARPLPRPTTMNGRGKRREGPQRAAERRADADRVRDRHRRRRRRREGRRRHRLPERPSPRPVGRARASAGGRGRSFPPRRPRGARRRRSHRRRRGRAVPLRPVVVPRLLAASSVAGGRAAAVQQLVQPRPVRPARRAPRHALCRRRVALPAGGRLAAGALAAGALAADVLLFDFFLRLLLFLRRGVAFTTGSGSTPPRSVQQRGCVRAEACTWLVPQRTSMPARGPRSPVSYSSSAAVLFWSKLEKQGCKTLARQTRHALFESTR